MKSLDTIGRKGICCRIIIILLTFLLADIAYGLVNAQHNNIEGLYWEKISDSVKEATIISDETNIDAVNYYNSRFKYADTPQSFRLLKVLVSKPENANIKALYFYLFNKICVTSDGAGADILGNFCQKVILNDPIYVFNYLQTNGSLMETYAMLLGYELYFKEDGTSDIEYNFNDFKGLVYGKIGNNPNVKRTFDNFSNQIEVVIKSMD